MSKEICAICGTSYPDSLDQCPVCGCSKEMDFLDFSDDVLMGEDGEIFAEEAPKKTRTIFDYDQVNSVNDPEPDLDLDDEEFDEEIEEEERSNTGLVVVLVILIVLLLAAAGFIFLRYFMPNMAPKETAPTTIATTAPVEVETEAQVVDDSIPCTDIVVPGGKIELVPGGKWLMNVQVFPENTTDTLVYVSADDTIATVTEDGAVAAVGEGQTVIIVTCGKASVKCNVVVDSALAEETVSDATIPTMQAETEEEPQTETVAQEQPAEETEPAETTAPTIPEGEVLKLKKTDITLFARYTSVTLELDCQIPAESITWFTMDSSVAIVNNGVVTSTGSGITRIYGEYNGQQVECIIRCNF